MSDRQRDRPRVGELRPSQLLHTFGVGSIVDLPQPLGHGHGAGRLADTDYARRSARSGCWPPSATQLGQPGRTPCVDRRRARPRPSNPFDESAQVGVPVAPFPRWLLCPLCRLLAPLESAACSSSSSTPYRPDRTRYVHANCRGKRQAAHRRPGPLPRRLRERPPRRLPVGRVRPPGREPCAGPGCELREPGGQRAGRRRPGRAATPATRRRRMAAGVRRGGRERLPALPRPPSAPARRSTSRLRPAGRTILLGASNAWFAVQLSALSIPSAAGRARPGGRRALGRPRAHRQARRCSRFARGEPKLRDLRRATTDDRAVGGHRGAPLAGGQRGRRARPTCAARSGRCSATRPAPAAGRRLPAARRGAAGRLRRPSSSRSSWPSGCARSGADRVHPHRRARRPRATAPSGSGRRWPATAPRGCRAPRSAARAIFLRSTRSRGRAGSGESRPATARRRSRGRRALAARPRSSTPTTAGPACATCCCTRFAHALIRELALECGYTAAAIRERIYADGDRRRARWPACCSTPPRPTARARSAGWSRLGEPGPARASCSPRRSSARGCAAPTRCAPSTTRRGDGSAARRRLPRLPVRPRDLLRARQPLPRPVAAGRHLRPRRPGVLRP